MRRVNAAVVLAVGMLAACSGGKQEGVVKFYGSTPNTSVQKAKFVREYQSFCPNCGKEIAYGATKCPNRRTCEGVLLTWPNEYVCGSCKGTGQCGACAWMDQMATGECYNCRGKGDLILQGQGKPCPNCGGKKVCPICEGTKKCDWCKGSGRVGADLVKKTLRKGSGVGEEELLPTEKRPEEKKTEEKKPEEKKSDEKKEEK